MRSSTETRRGALPCLAALWLLGGCTASLPEAAPDGRDMRSVFHAQLGRPTLQNPPQRTESAAFSPHRADEFRRLPNPALVMWIHPHFVGDNEAPVPGYVTAFFLYPRDHFALPGEWAPP